MTIINPTFKLQNEDLNIFTIRKKDYEQILPLTRQIVAPVQDIGFTITELDLKDSRFSSGELFKTVKQTLVIKLQKGNSIIDVSIIIPKLMDDNYVIINGRRKIPLFQLFDIPIITRGDNIKIRTNIGTIMVFNEKSDKADPPHIKISFLGKKIYLSSLLFAYYGMEEVNRRFELSTTRIDIESTSLYEILRSDLAHIYGESRGYLQDDFISEIGREYSKYNSKSKGEDILYAIDLIPKVDPLSTRFFHTETLLDEVVYAIKTEFIDDMLFTNKRVRCFEYMVVAKISKIIFDLCFANRTARQPKFNINSTQILSECNVSEIVQFDFSINPIEELTKLSRISLLGPGGFKRENIPQHLRDICPTMFGRICPVDTPDRDNCGVLQNLIPNVHLDENLRFQSAICDRQPLSIPVSFTPFLKHDDQTRLQMASSQMRQAIMLKSFDPPLIASGCEGLYTNKTQFIKIAKHDGEVLHIDKDYMIVIYSNGEPDIFDIKSRKIYVEHLDFLHLYVKPGDKFKAGDILAESNFCHDGKVTIGKNLLTGVMIHYGNNYEDGIIISDRLQKEDILTSVHYEDLSFSLSPDKVLLSLNPDKKYNPLPEELQRLQRGETYARAQRLHSEDPNAPFTEELTFKAKRNFIISEVNIYANEWNQEVKQFTEWVENKLEKQSDKEKHLQKIIKDAFGKDKGSQVIREKGIDSFSLSNVGKYKVKREKLQGIQVEMYGIHFRKIHVGDKLANRHGNKGVVSKIVAHEKMPKLEDGRHVDICINPLGIISRMNIGQLYELHLTMSVQDLKINMLKMLADNNKQEEIKDYLLNFIKIIDKTNNSWFTNQFQQQLPEEIDINFIKDLSIIQPPFESSCLEDLKIALKYTGTRFKYKLFDPLSSSDIINEIAVGYIYFFRMVHIAEEKLAARGIGAYTRRTLQPLGGRKNKGGQRCGEMETACLIGHDAPSNLFEFLTTKSDCTDMKNDYIRNFIEANLIDKKENANPIPESVKLLNSYLTVIGVDQK